MTDTTRASHGLQSDAHRLLERARYSGKAEALHEVSEALRHILAFDDDMSRNGDTENRLAQLRRSIETWQGLYDHTAKGYERLVETLGKD